MAFAITSIGSLGDTTARSDFTCMLSRAPADNALVLVSVLVSDTAGTPVEPSSVSGSGLVFSLVTSSRTFAPIAAAQTLNHSVWRGMGAGLSNSVITAHFPNATTGCDILVDEVSGVSTSGTSGANAVGKSATSAADAGTSALTIFGPSATSTANAWYSSVGVTTETSVDVANPNWISLASVAYPTPNTGLFSAWTTLSTGTTVWWNGAGSRDRGGVTIELVLDNPVVIPVADPVYRRQLRVPNVPSTITGEIARYLGLVAKQLNSEGYISLFSGVTPEVAGSFVTAPPGHLAVNIGSASTNTRLWIMTGSVPSSKTMGWTPIRTA